MEHHDAMESHAAERYLLGELSPDERDAFEEHYFGCEECAAAVRDAATFVSSYRAVQRDDAAAKQPPRRAPYAWLATAAIVALVATLAYQNAVLIPRLRREQGSDVPHVLHSISLAGASRAEASESSVRGGAGFALWVDVPPEPTFPRYRCEIVDAAGAVRATFHVTAAEAKEPVALYVPARRLNPGKYSVVVNGVDARTTKIETLPFSVSQ